MSPKTKARALAHSERGFVEYVVFQRTGRLVRDFDDYPPLTLMALLMFAKQTQSELDRVSKAADAGEPYEFVWYPQRAGAGVDPSVPITTGDKVADEWEKALAAGRIPDDWIGKE